MNKFYPAFGDFESPDQFEIFEPVDPHGHEFEDSLLELMCGYGYKSVVNFLIIEQKYPRPDALVLADQIHDRMVKNELPK